MGKAQFETVAAASKEFDMYMKETLGAVDAELARREETRHDRFGSHARSTRAERSKETVYRRSGGNMNDPESEDDDSSDASENSDSDNDDEEEEEDRDRLGPIGHKRQSKISISGPSNVGTPTSAVDTDEDEYEQWKKFQEMKKKQKGKK